MDVTGLFNIDFSLLFQACPDVLLVLAPDARFTMIAATDARLEATHTTRATLGQGLFDVFPDNPGDPDANGTGNLRASLERVLKTRQPDTMPVQRYDIRGTSGEFESRYWSPKNIPVLSPAGEVLYILHRVEDVTDLVRASELGEALRGRTQAMEREVIRRSQELEVALGSLRESNLRLSQLDSAKTVFFDSISQEFRTPLALILGTLEEELAVTNKALPAQSRIQLRVAHRNSLRLLKLVNTLLDFSRIEAGRMQAHYQPTDLARLTAELAGNFQSVVHRGGVTLNVDCPPLPEAVHVDRAMWEKIVLNLLSNAFKHTTAGSITVSLRARGDRVQLDVEDTGAGIAAADLPQLFDRFRRLQPAAARSHEGTGLGLPLVQELVKLHAGDIAVDSAPGRGSRFTVTLKSGVAHLPAEHVGTNPETFAPGRCSAPYVEEALNWTAPAGVGAAVEPDAGPAVPAWRPPRARILCVDDNPDMRAYVARLLRRSFEVTEAGDGQEALELALAAPPDLVLSDVMMPRLDGYGLLRALRADSRTRRLPIILLSARAGDNATITGLDAGADDYLVKPFAARELLARVRTHVELAWQRRAWENQLEQQVSGRTAELEAQVRRLELLARLTRGMAECRDLDGMFRFAVRAIEEALPADACWIGPAAALSPAPQSEPLPPELAGLGLRAVVTVPLRAQNEDQGVLLVARRAAESFSSMEREFLRQLGEHVAIATRHGRLNETLQAACDELQLTQPARRPAQRAASAETDAGPTAESMACRT
ncbi:MAG TPA: ATP-binding protein [Steroidobacteraceae bacterium]|nr:ATP-binding protein [Steroidobacteraceae bacterium]